MELYLKNNPNLVQYIKEKNPKYEIEYLDYEEVSLMHIYRKYNTFSLFKTQTLYLIDNAYFLSHVSKKLKKKEEEIFQELVLKEKNNNNKLIFLVNDKLNLKINYVKQNQEYFIYNDNIANDIDKKLLKKYPIAETNLLYLKEIIKEEYNYQKELEKLDLFLKKQEFTKEIIETYVPQKIDFNIFKFIESIITNNQETMKKYFYLLEEEEITQEAILATMYTQLKFYLNFKILLNQNYSNYEIQSKLNTNAYRLNSSKKIVQKISINNLINLFEKIAFYDFQIKSGRTKEKNVLINFLLKEKNI